jgi:hypothetical protein
MVNVWSKAEEPIGSLKTAMENLRDKLPDDEYTSLIERWTKSGGLSLDHEALELAGLYAQVVQVARFLDSIASHTPEMLRGVLQEVREHQTERDQAVIRELRGLLGNLDASRLNIEKVAKKSIRSSGDEKEKIPSAVLWSAVGATGALLLSTFLFQFIYVPMQLRQARGAEGALIEWLGTSDGALLRQTFSSGNTSVQNCVGKARSKGKRDKNKLVCLIELENSR